MKDAIEEMRRVVTVLEDEAPPGVDGRAWVKVSDSLIGYLLNMARQQENKKPPRRTRPQPRQQNYARSSWRGGR